MSSSTQAVVIPAEAPEADGTIRQAQSASLAKADRKRLKKLRKRVANVISEGEMSGLLTQSDWLEFQKFAAADHSGPLLVGPLVSRRKHKERNKVEGSHHRDLIAWFMDRMRCPDDTTTPSKKRSRKEDPLQNPSIPSWASIHNPAMVEGLVVVEVQLLSAKLSLLEECQSAVDAAAANVRGRSTLHLPTKWFQGHVPKAMSDSLFYFVATSQSGKQDKSEQENVPSREQLIRSLEEMILPEEDWVREGYPVRVNGAAATTESLSSPHPPTTSIEELNSLSIPLEGDSKKCVATCGFRVKDQKEDDERLYVSTCVEGSTSPAEARVFGMDCEMVLTSAGSELARITLVQMTSFTDDKLETTTVLDALVKPENPVKDYLTRHSGITAEALEPVSTRLEQVQVALRQFLRPSDILVGHSLENDLIAARYIHHRVVDTALTFRHRNKRTKFSLRHMSASLLKKTIQRGSHCSEEDAETTLELAIRRAWLGDAFALPNMDERRSVLEKWNGSTEMKIACIGPANWLQSHVTNQANGVHALGCESLMECKKALLAWTKGPRKARLTWCQVGVSSETTNNVADFQNMVTELILQTAPTTSFLFAFQEGLDRARQEYKVKRACQDHRSSVGWSPEREIAWQPVLESSRQGFASWIGSSNNLAE